MLLYKRRRLFIYNSCLKRALKISARSGILFSQVNANRDLPQHHM